MEFLSGEYIARLLGVLRAILVLSGDGVVVIATTARSLQGRQRRQA